MNNKDLYLVYVRSSNFVARMIQFFMRLYALKFNRIWRKPVNHADIVYKGVVWGTTAHGFLPRSKREAWDKATELWVYKPEITANAEEVLAVLHRYQYRPYDFMNFWDFIVKLFTGEWRGKRGFAAEARLFCIEAVHMVLDDLGVSTSLHAAWDNDPEESRQWAIDNLEFIEKIKL